MQEDLELALKRIAELERKIEIYYQLLHIDNELDFIINGTYVSPNEMDAVVNGSYQMETSANTGEDSETGNSSSATETPKEE